MRVAKLPLPLLLAALVIAVGVIVFYVRFSVSPPLFVWSNVENNTVYYTWDSPFKFYISGFRYVRIETNATLNKVYDVPTSIILIYSYAPIKGNITLNDGRVVYRLENASGVFFKVEVAPGCYVYLKQIADGLWVPDFEGIYTAVDPQDAYDKQVIGVDYDENTNQIAYFKRMIYPNGFIGLGGDCRVAASNVLTYNYVSSIEVYPYYDNPDLNVWVMQMHLIWAEGVGPIAFTLRPTR